MTSTVVLSREDIADTLDDVKQMWSALIDLAKTIPGTGPVLAGRSTLPPIIDAIFEQAASAAPQEGAGSTAGPAANGEPAAAAFVRSAARTYEPLTEERIEQLREGARDPNGHPGWSPTNGEVRTLCDMAGNALLYAQEIERLRSLPSSERVSAALHACEGLDTSDLKGNAKGWLAELVNDVHRIEAQNNSLLDAVCVGNKGCDLKARCQSYEASEQATPCPAGRCVMAEDEPSAESATRRTTVPIKVRPMLVSGMLADSDDGLVILIDSEQPETEQVLAFWHEVLHLVGLVDEVKTETHALALAGACPQILRLLAHNINVPNSAGDPT